MQPSVNKLLVASKSNEQRKDTAFYIFDRGAQVPYRVSMAHHRAHNGAMGDPIMGYENQSKLDSLATQMIYVQSPVMEVVDYFMAGASLDISPETMELIYERIENHIDAHTKAMRERANYYIGDTFEVFEQLVEFAVSIYPRVKDYRDRHKKVDRNDDPFLRMVTGRANFMTILNREAVKIEQRDSKNGFQPCPLIDKLERMQLYYESSQSWRN